MPAFEDYGVTRKTRLSKKQKQKLRRRSGSPEIQGFVWDRPPKWKNPREVRKGGLVGVRCLVLLFSFIADWLFGPGGWRSETLFAMAMEASAVAVFFWAFRSEATLAKNGARLTWKASLKRNFKSRRCDLAWSFRRGRSWAAVHVFESHREPQISQTNQRRWPDEDDKTTKS